MLHGMVAGLWWMGACATGGGKDSAPLESGPLGTDSQPADPTFGTRTYDTPTEGELPPAGVFVEASVDGVPFAFACAEALTAEQGTATLGTDQRLALAFACAPEASSEGSFSLRHTGTYTGATLADNVGAYASGDCDGTDKDWQLHLEPSDGTVVDSGCGEPGYDSLSWRLLSVLSQGGGLLRLAGDLSATRDDLELELVGTFHVTMACTGCP